MALWHPSVHHKTEIHTHPSHLAVADHYCNVKLHLASFLCQSRQLSGTAVTWEAKSAPQLLHNAGIYCGVGRNMIEILALKEGYTPELSFPEQVQGLVSNYIDNASHYHPETSEFCEVLNLRRGMK